MPRRARLAALADALAVAALDLLRELGQLAQLLAPLLGAEFAISKNVFDVEASVRPDAVMGNVASIEQLDQEGSRHTEDVAGLLRRQLLVVRDQGDSQPLGHVTNDRAQGSERGARDLHLASIRPDESRRRPFPVGCDPR